MKRFKKAIRSEMDVEFFACVHSMSMIAVLGFELFLYGIKSISYVTIFQIFVMAYIVSWFQKMLFIKERMYSKKEYIIRSVLWNIGPIIITIITGSLFNWYNGLPKWISIVFIIVMLIYYVMVWGAIQVFYKDESEELNNMLSKYKENYSRGKDENEHN